MCKNSFLPILQCYSWDFFKTKPSVYNYKRVKFQYIDFYLFIMKIFQFSMNISIIRLEKRGGKSPTDTYKHNLKLQMLELVLK